jgi:transposase-like protein
MEVSRETILESLGPLQKRAQDWLTRPLGQPYWALFIDGVNIKTRRRDSVELEPSLIVVGVDENNHRSILAVEPGARENVASWRAAFAALKRRGLDPSAVRVAVMDGLPGLENAFREAFPGAATSRCWLHALRNAVAKAPDRVRTPFKELAERVKYASSEDAARNAFKKLKEAMGEDGQRAVDCLEKDLDALVAHYKFDKKYWQALKTTNPVERVNREIRRRTRTMDAVGEGNLGVVIAFTALRLEAGWRRQKVDSRAIYNLALKSKAAISPEEATGEAMATLVASSS